MKKIYFSLFLLSALFISLYSCKKEEYPLGVYTCKVDSITPWSATKETIAIHAGSPLNIIGRDDNTTFIINLIDVNDPDTYIINDNSVHKASYQDGEGTFDIYRNNYGSSGSVIITEISETRVKGTFNLHLSNSFVLRHFVEGAFDIEIHK